MGFGERIITAIRRRKSRIQLSQPGAIGDFWRAGGNRLLSANLPVDSTSTVIDGGTYKGDWLESVVIRYGCRVDAYEAVPEYARRLSDRYSQNERISVHPFALGAASRTTDVALAADRSTLLTQRFRGSPVRVAIETLDTHEEICRIAEQCHISCVKLNVEGSEYEILEHLTARGALARSTSWLIQFHNIGDQSIERRNALREALAQTHECVWCYEFVWELWVRKTVL